MRFYFRLITVFLVRFKWLILVSGILGVVIFAAIYVLTTRSLNTKVEKIGMVGRYKSNNLPFSVLSQVSMGLTKIDDSQQVIGDAAESWDVSADGKEWTFNLKHNLVWQDGKPVKTEDINYEFSDVQINKPDDYTLVFKLNTPFSPLPSILNRPLFRKGLLGIGDWKVTKISTVSTYVQDLEIANGNYKKIIKFYLTEDAARLAYKLGEVNELVDLFSPSPFDQWKGTTITKDADLNKIAILFFNTQNDPFKRKEFRQALNYAIDKDSFNGIRALSPISPTSWAFNPQVKQYAYDPKRAKEMISDLMPKGSNIEVKLITPPSLLGSAEKIANYWRDVGVQTTVQASGISQGDLPSDYQAFLAVLDIPTDPDQYSFWHSTQTVTNSSKYNNPRIDKLLEDGRMEQNNENRKKIYWDFQRYLLEDSPAVFLYNPYFYNIYRK